MLLRHGRRIFKVSKEVRNTSLLFFDYISGAACDRYGIRSSIIFGLMLIVLGHFMFFIQQTLVVTFLGLLLAAIGVAFMWMPVDVIIRKHVERDVRAEAVGFSDTAYGMGGIFAPLAVGVLASTENFSIPFYITLCLFLLSGLVFHTLIRE